MNYANQVIDRCRSTNDLVKELAEKGYPHGTWVSARAQEAGRGRLGRKWSSIEGNLFLSYLTRIEPRERWSWIPLTTAVATVRCLAGLFPEISLRIKWPNDLWVSYRGADAKLGGILCEGTSSSHPYIVVGIGLNCRQAPDSQTVGQQAADLTSCLGGRAIHADDVRAPLIESLNDSFGRLATDGKEWVAQEYEKWNLFSPGTEVAWGSPQLKATVVGLGDSGELIVRNSAGEVRGLFSEELSVRPALKTGEPRVQ